MENKLIDAALNSNGVAYFFSADYFVSYDWKADRVKDGVHHISDFMNTLNFPWDYPFDIMRALNSALKGKEQFADKAYFFKDKQYVRFNMPSKFLETRAPLPISVWGFPATFVGAPEAAFNGKFSRSTKAYFFKGKNYIRYDWKKDKVDDGYPLPISKINGMTPDFISNIEAAIDGDGSFSDFGYLFKGDQYLRFNWNAKGGEPSGEGPSRPIKENWAGLMELLMVGKAITEARTWINSAVNQLNLYKLSFDLQLPLPPPAKTLMEEALLAHFKIKKSLSSSLKSSKVNDILNAYSSILGTFNLSATKFKFDANTKPKAPAYASFNGNISFTRIYGDYGPHARTAMLIHETVHYFDKISGKNTTHIPEWYLTNAAADALKIGRSADNSDFATRYDLMNTADSLHNPSCYAAFAQHLFYGSDTRYGAGRQG